MTKRKIDARRWEDEPFVTRKNLQEMSAVRAKQIIELPNWECDHFLDVLYNLSHPDNANRLRRHNALMELLNDQR